MPLPMSRRDIADYLGLTLETVSRALSRLHELGIIGFIGSNQRQIVLLDRQQLASLDLQHLSDVASADRIRSLPAGAAPTIA